MRKEEFFYQKSEVNSIEKYERIARNLDWKQVFYGIESNRRTDFDKSHPCEEGGYQGRATEKRFMHCLFDCNTKEDCRCTDCLYYDNKAKLINSDVKIVDIEANVLKTKGNIDLILSYKGQTFFVEVKPNRENGKETILRMVLEILSYDFALSTCQESKQALYAHCGTNSHRNAIMFFEKEVDRITHTEQYKEFFGLHDYPSPSTKKIMKEKDVSLFVLKRVKDGYDIEFTDSKDI